MPTTSFYDDTSEFDASDPGWPRSHWHDSHALVDDTAFDLDPSGGWLTEDRPPAVDGKFLIEVLALEGVGAASVKTIRLLKALRRHQESWPTRTDAEVRQLFAECKDRWLAATRFQSSISVKIRHPDYQRIIGLGLQAVPHILRALHEQEHDWFWALFAIVGRDVAAGTQTVEDAAEAWLRWGRERGYVD